MSNNPDAFHPTYLFGSVLSFGALFHVRDIKLEVNDRRIRN
jgi:hypothetical protein